MGKIDIAALRAKALASIAAAKELAGQPAKENGHVAEAEVDAANDANDTDVSGPVHTGSNLPACDLQPSDGVSDILQDNAGIIVRSDALPASTEVVPAAIPTVGSAVELTPQQFQLVEKIAQLKELLLAGDPQMPVLLKQIHTVTHKQPELIYFLQPEQIGVIVKACMEQTKVVVVASAVKATKTASGKKLSQIGLEDI